MKLHVLLVEDEVEIRQIVSRQLEKRAEAVHQAENGAVGIEVINKHPEINLAIIDLQMSKMDGYEFIEILHRDRPDIKKIVLTANKLPDAMVEKLEKSKIVGILYKPVSKQELVSYIDCFAI